MATSSSTRSNLWDRLNFGLGEWCLDWDLLTLFLLTTYEIYLWSGRLPDEVLMFLGWWSPWLSLYFPCFCSSFAFFLQIASSTLMWVEACSRICAIYSSMCLSEDSRNEFTRKPFTNASTTISSLGFWMRTDTTQKWLRYSLRSSPSRCLTSKGRPFEEALLYWLRTVIWTIFQIPRRRWWIHPKFHWTIGESFLWTYPWTFCIKLNSILQRSTYVLWMLSSDFWGLLPRRKGLLLVSWSVVKLAPSLSLVRISEN